jgi:hypothetical protein
MESTITRLSSASLGLGLALAFAIPLTTSVLAGCTDAGKCVRGEIGCACSTEGTCKTGGTCNTDRMCIEREGPPPEEDSGTPPPPPPDVDCVDTDFASACTAFCDAFCTMQERMCAASTCTVSECEATFCDAICAGGDADCMASRCEIVKNADCPGFALPDPDTDVLVSFCLMNDPICAPDPEFGCSDTCGSNAFKSGGDLAPNGICQDGATGSTGNKRCERSTDCTDCDRRTCGAMNDPCDTNGDCCGFTEGDSFCIQGRQVCYATCSDAHPCEAGDTCSPLDGSDDSVCVPPP